MSQQKIDDMIENEGPRRLFPLSRFSQRLSLCLSFLYDFTTYQMFVLSVNYVCANTT